MKANLSEWSAPAHRTRPAILPAFGGRWASVTLGAIAVVAGATHFLNLVGFPPMGPDEGNVVGQAIATQATWNPYPAGGHLYGQPFVGWYLLALLFALIGFPPPTVGGDLGSIYGFYFVPRAIAASLAVVDTLLLYLVGRRLLQGEGPALVAAALLAVAPASVLYLRLPLLQVLLVPWLLLALHLTLGARDRGSPLGLLAAGLAFAAAVLTWLPALLLAPAFPALLLRPGRREGWPRGLALAAWTTPVAAALLAWVGYAAAHPPLLDHVAAAVGWAPANPPGLGLGGLLDRLFALDPLLLGLGLAGIPLLLFRRRFTAALLPLLALATLASLAVLWDYHAALLVPLLALPAGFLVAAALGFAVALFPRPGEGRRLRAVPLAPLLAVALVVALVLPSASLGIARDENWAALSASHYIAREAPPFAVVLANAPYVPLLERARPDLWVLNWWDAEFQVLQEASLDPAARAQRVFLRDTLGNLKFDGTVVGPVTVQLAAGDYVALGRRGDLSAGEVAFHLDRDLGILFLTYGLPPLLLVDARAPPGPGPHRVTLLDPVAMPKLLLVDDQLRADAERIPFLKHLAGEDGPTLYAANNEESIHEVALPAGVYVVKVWGPGHLFLGSILVKLDADAAIVFNVDAPAASAQGFEVAGPLDPSVQHGLRIMVQHGNGLPLAWAWVEVQRVNGLAYYENGLTSAEVRLAAA